MTRGVDAPPVKIVVTAPNWLGDAVMCLPALALLATGGRAVVAVASRPYTARVFLGLDGVDELWIGDTGGRLAHLRARTRALDAYGADAVVLLPTSFSSALPAWLAGVKHRIGFRGDARAWLLSDAAPAPERRTHLTESCLALARRARERLGLAEAREPVPFPRLSASAREREHLRARLSGSAAAGGYAVLVPGAAFGPAKSWPWERYRVLCARLARDLPVVVAGSAGDRAVCERVADGIDNVANLAGHTDLGGMFALIEGARVLVANDSGSAHVAAAMGTPVVVLFGSTSPEWTAPLGPRVEVLRHPVHCSPCFRRTCPTQLECFHGIEVDAVLAAVGRVVGAVEKAFVAAPGGRIESRGPNSSNAGVPA